MSATAFSAKTPNLPASFSGWGRLYRLQHRARQTGWSRAAARVGNDGNMAAWPRRGLARGNTRATVMMLMPGSGLGAAFVGAERPFAWMATRSQAWKPVTCPPRCICSVSPANRSPAAADATGAAWRLTRPFPGLPQLLAEFIKRHPGHELATSTAPIKEKVLSLRTRAQKGDTLALEIFDFQARVNGLHVANLVMALDPGIVVIGGGLMDHEATTRNSATLHARDRETAVPYFWAPQRGTVKIVPAELGELSRPSGGTGGVLS